MNEPIAFAVLRQRQFSLFTSRERWARHVQVVLPYTLLSWVPLSVCRKNRVALYLEEEELNQLEPTLSEILASNFPILVWVTTNKPTPWPEHCLANSQHGFVGRVVEGHLKHINALLPDIEQTLKVGSPALVESVREVDGTTPLGHLQLERTGKGRP